MFTRKAAARQGGVMLQNSQERERQKEKRRRNPFDPGKEYAKRRFFTDSRGTGRRQQLGGEKDLKREGAVLESLTYFHCSWKEDVTMVLSGGTKSFAWNRSHLS